jgi:protein-disulfide isomerase
MEDPTAVPSDSTDDGDEIDTLLADIPQSANALGEPVAPVTLEYFGDLECPFCRAFSLEVLPLIIQRWVRTGKLRIEYRALQTATREPDVFVAQQVAALAAGKQDKAWQFVETFYAEQGEEGSGYVTETYLHAIAGQIPHLDVPRWATERNDPALPKEIASDAEVAENAGLTGTPSFLLGPSGGSMRMFSPTGQASFDAAIETLAGA